MGLPPRHLLVPPVVGRVVPDAPAWGVLAEGDRITAVDGEPVATWGDIGPMVQRLGERGGVAMIEVERGGDRLALEVQPRRQAATDAPDRWGLGIGSGQQQGPAVGGGRGA